MVVRGYFWELVFCSYHVGSRDCFLMAATLAIEPARAAEHWLDSSSDHRTPRHWSLKFQQTPSESWISGLSNPGITSSAQLSSEAHTALYKQKPSLWLGAQRVSHSLAQATAGLSLTCTSGQSLGCTNTTGVRHLYLDAREEAFRASKGGTWIPGQQNKM